MRWLSIRGHDGDVSRSMVALAISLLALLAAEALARHVRHEAPR